MSNDNASRYFSSVNLSINFVWIGPRALGWLERFIMYAWKMYNCEVNLYTHRGPGTTHDETSLGLPPNICNIIDLSSTLSESDALSTKVRITDFERTRNVLLQWYAKPILPWEFGGQEQIFNMVDLTKSYLGATRRGIVLDLKIAPTIHLPKYVEAGAFENFFVSYMRKGTLENQCMGSMNESSDLRRKYGNRFQTRLFPSPGEAADFVKDYNTILFGAITGAHIFALTLGWKAGTDFLDIGKYGEKLHRSVLKITDAQCEGIAKEQSYGPLRIFKREGDQTNSSGEKTTPEDIIGAYHLTTTEIAEASVGARAAVDVTAPGMPPIKDLLDLLSRARPA